MSTVLHGNVVMPIITCAALLALSSISTGWGLDQPGAVEGVGIDDF